MRSIWTNFGVFIGLGLFAVVLAIALPFYLNERCKNRWPLLETAWHFETGCAVRVGGAWFREENVSVIPRK
jgi:hypothetical protein